MHLHDSKLGTSIPICRLMQKGKGNYLRLLEQFNKMCDISAKFLFFLLDIFLFLLQEENAEQEDLAINLHIYCSYLNRVSKNKFLHLIGPIIE